MITERKNTPRMIPLLDYLRGKGEVTRLTLLEDDESPVCSLDVSQVRQLLKRMVANGYIVETKRNTFKLI